MENKPFNNYFYDIILKWKLLFLMIETKSTLMIGKKCDFSRPDFSHDTAKCLFIYLLNTCI